MITPTIGKSLVVATIILFATPIVVLGEGDSHVQPGHGWKLREKPEEASLDVLFSPTFRREIVSANISKHLRVSGGDFQSEGQPFRQMTAGWVFKPKNPSDKILSLEVYGGIAAIRGQRTAPVVGYRFVYLSKKWFAESWITLVEEKRRRILGEPFADLFKGLGRGFYAGFSSSYFNGTPIHHGHYTHHEKSVLGGLGMLWRGNLGKVEIDGGFSLETNILRGGRKYAGGFASATYRFAK